MAVLYINILLVKFFFETKRDKRRYKIMLRRMKIISQRSNKARHIKSLEA